MSPNTSRSTKKASAALVAGTGGAERRRKILIQVAVAAVLVALIGAIGISIAHKRSAQSATPTAVPAQAREDGAIRVGPADAAQVITVVEDFQCPVCKRFEADAAATLADLVAGGDVAIDYRPIAILDRVSTTRYSTRAASAAYCVADSDPARWVAWHDAMFERQPAEGGAGLSDDGILDIAASVGIDRAAVADCVTGNTYADYVTAKTRDGAAAGIDRTPTVLIGGTEIRNPTPAALRAALGK